MPCYSKITKTKITDHLRLAQAMKDLGHDVSVDRDGLFVRGDSMTFSRGSVSDAFSTTSDSPQVAEVGKRYAMVSLRAWAQRTGYAVAAVDSDKITLKNRRG